MISEEKKQIKTIDDVLQRYPRLTAHLISESLGYFTPRSAANAIQAYIQNRAFACEWYVHMARAMNDEKLLEVGKNTLADTFRNRHYHFGSMRNYDYALALVNRSRNGGQDPIGASWF
jgi:hypothetical protein